MDLNNAAAALGLETHSKSTSYSSILTDEMEDDDMSFADTPAEDVNDQYSLETQIQSLQNYLKSVPYECEPPEYMQDRLGEIVGKIVVCAKAQNWHVMTVWDKMLQWHVYHSFFAAGSHS